MLSNKSCSSDADELQPVPQKMMLDRVICLLEVHKARIQKALRDTSCVDEVAQGEELIKWGLPGPEACLVRAAQLIHFRPSHQPSVEYDRVQPAKRLAQSYGPAVSGSKRNPFCRWE